MVIQIFCFVLTFYKPVKLRGNTAWFRWRHSGLLPKNQAGLPVSYWLAVCFSIISYYSHIWRRGEYAPDGSTGCASYFWTIVHMQKKNHSTVKNCPILLKWKTYERKTCWESFYWMKSPSAFTRALILDMKCLQAMTTVSLLRLPILSFILWTMGSECSEDV